MNIFICKYSVRLNFQIVDFNFREHFIFKINILRILDLLTKKQIKFVKLEYFEILVPISMFMVLKCLRKLKSFADFVERHGTRPFTVSAG